MNQTYLHFFPEPALRIVTSGRFSRTRDGFELENKVIFCEVATSSTGEKTVTQNIKLSKTSFSHDRLFLHSLFSYQTFVNQRLADIEDYILEREGKNYFLHLKYQGKVCTEIYRNLEATTFPTFLFGTAEAMAMFYWMRSDGVEKKTFSYFPTSLYRDSGPQNFKIFSTIESSSEQKTKVKQLEFHATPLELKRTATVFTFHENGELLHIDAPRIEPLEFTPIAPQKDDFPQNIVALSPFPTSHVKPTPIENTVIPVMENDVLFQSNQHFHPEHQPLFLFDNFRLNILPDPMTLTKEAFHAWGNHTGVRTITCEDLVGITSKVGLLGKHVLYPDIKAWCSALLDKVQGDTFHCSQLVVMKELAYPILDICKDRPNSPTLFLVSPLWHHSNEQDRLKFYRECYAGFPTQPFQELLENYPGKIVIIDQKECFSSTRGNNIEHRYVERVFACEKPFMISDDVFHAIVRRDSNADTTTHSASL